MQPVQANQPRVFLHSIFAPLEPLASVAVVLIGAAASYGLYQTLHLPCGAALATFLATCAVSASLALCLRLAMTALQRRRTDRVLEAAGLRFEHCLQWVASRVDRWQGTGASGRRVRIEVFRSGPHVGMVRVRADLGRKALPGVIDGTRGGMSWSGTMMGHVLGWPQARIAARTLVSGHRRRRIALTRNEVCFEIVKPSERVGPHDIRQWVDAADKLASIVRWVAFEHEAAAETMVAPMSVQSLRELRIAAVYA